MISVLVAEDDRTTAFTLEHFLRARGYEVTVVDNGEDAFEAVCQGDFRMVISDWEMPGLDGPELCRRIRARTLGSYVYIILLTCHAGSHSIVEGLQAGADDFVAKPFRPDDLSVRLRVGERIAALESRDLVIFSMAHLAESRDPETGAHLQRMREYSRILAEEMRTWDDFKEVIDVDFVRALYLTSPLHDIGKVGIPDDILLKPGKLTPEEFEIMKTHTTIGGQTLDAAVQSHPQAGFLRMARDIAWTHHERFDGGGYPRHLVGEEIPLCGRIVCLADVYDALTSSRVYKEAFSHEVAREIVEKEMKGAFDPRVVEAFFARENDFMVTRARLDDSLIDTSVRYDAPLPVGAVS